MHPFVKDTTCFDKQIHLSRRVLQFVKTNEAKHQELFRKALQLFKKALSSFWGNILGGVSKFAKAIKRFQ